jgi:hypothetical protein
MWTILPARRRDHAGTKLPRRRSCNAAVDLPCGGKRGGCSGNHRPAFARPFPQQTPTTLTQIHPAKKSLSAVFVAPDGEGMPDVKVTLRQESGEKEFTAKTNDAGEISFSDLPKGTYTLTATAGGFHPFQLSGVKAPYAAQMHFQLDLGLMGEVVEVKQPDYQPDRIHRFFSNVKHLF